MRSSLFAAEEREAKLSKLGDPLEPLHVYVDFAEMAGLAAGVRTAG